MTTAWLLPGSLTVMNCSSLYFSNAGPSSFTRFGVERVRALISAPAYRVRTLSFNRGAGELGSEEVWAQRGSQGSIVPAITSAS